MLTHLLREISCLFVVCVACSALICVNPTAVIVVTLWFQVKLTKEDLGGGDGERREGINGATSTNGWTNVPKPCSVGDTLMAQVNIL